MSCLHRSPVSPLYPLPFPNPLSTGSLIIIPAAWLRNDHLAVCSAHRIITRICRVINVSRHSGTRESFHVANVSSVAGRSGSVLYPPREKYGRREDQIRESPDCTTERHDQRLYAAAAPLVSFLSSSAPRCTARLTSLLVRATGALQQPTAQGKTSHSSLATAGSAIILHRT